MEDDGLTPRDRLIAQGAKERAIHTQHLTFVDLPALRQEWNFNPAVTDNNDEIVQEILGLPEGRINTGRVWNNLQKTNREKLEAQIDLFVQSHPEVLKKLGITSLGAANPAVVATFCLEMAAQSMKYAHEIVPGEAKLSDPEWQEKIRQMQTDGSYASFVKEERERYDGMSPDELLEAGRGVCGHYALAAMGIYEQLKTRPDCRQLAGTFLVYTDDFATGDLNHAFDIFVAMGQENNLVSLNDPTWYISKNLFGEEVRSELFTDARLLTAIRTMSAPALRTRLGIPPMEFAGAIDGQIAGLEEKIKGNQGVSHEADVDRFLGMRMERAGLVQPDRWRTYGTDLAQAADRLMDLAQSRKKPGLTLDNILWSHVLRSAGGDSAEAVLKVAQRAVEMKNSGQLPAFQAEEIRNSLKWYSDYYTTMRLTDREGGSAKLVEQITEARTILGASQ